jgi:sugar phosphate isomerase/epimerase
VEELGVKKEYKSFEGSAVIVMIPRGVTTTDVFEEGYDAARAVDRLATLGYDGIDMGFDYWIFEGSPFLADDYLAWAEGLKARADEKGVVYTHAHAPGEADSEYVERSIAAAAALGARYLVVHPVWKDKNGDIIKSKLRFLQVNAEAIKKWLPMAEEYGVVLLSENVLWGASSDPRIIAQLVEKVGSDWFHWCFDVGHAWACGYAPDVLKKCAVTPASLHIQDNDGSGDQHLIPGDGTIDWDLFTQTLRETGYLGDCVMEAHHQSLEAPDEERDAILARLLGTAQTIRDRMR